MYGVVGPEMDEDDVWPIDRECGDSFVDNLVDAGANKRHQCIRHFVRHVFTPVHGANIINTTCRGIVKKWGQRNAIP